MDLTLGMVKAPRTCPAITSCINGLITVICANPVQLACDQIKGGLPINLYKAVRPALARRDKTLSLQPALAHHRGGYPRRGIQNIDKPPADIRRIGIFGKGLHICYATLFHFRLVGSPMRTG